MMRRALTALLLLMPLHAGAQIGRLFTTPEERLQLDIQRGTAAAPALPVSAPPAAPVMVDGFVRRSGGKSTVWLNQSADSAPRVKGQGVSLNLPSGRWRLVKPGQSIDMNTGAISDSVEGVSRK